MKASVTVSADARGKTTTNDEAYTYDAMGNRLATRQYSNWAYDSQNDELDSWDAVSYSSDGNGNRATRTDASGITTYTYDFENRLVRVDRPGNNWTTYDYDALGRRVRKNNNGTVTLYWYEGEDIVLETSGAGTEQARYTHGPGIDAPLKVKRGSSTYYYHEDPLGSIVLMTDASKNASRTYKYDAFGNIITQTGSATNFYMYTGREYDSETALYYYRARTYDPKVGRFLQGDPLPPRPQEMNGYVYSRNNPIHFIDPDGLWCKNNTNAWIWVKPEHGPPQRLAPHDTFSGNIDGVKPPFWGGNWYKVKGNDYVTTNVTIEEDGTPIKSGALRDWPDACDNGAEKDDSPGMKIEPEFSIRNSEWKIQ